MSKENKYTVYGMTKKGEKVYLDQAELTEKEVREFLNDIKHTYVTGTSGGFHVGYAVFDVWSFAGVIAEKVGK